MKYILEARKEACFLYLNLPGIERQFVCVFVNQTQLIFYSFFGHLEQRVLTDKQQFWKLVLNNFPCYMTLWYLYFTLAAMHIIEISDTLQQDY